MRLQFTHALPVGPSDIGAEVDTVITVDIDPNEDVELRDAVVFVEPTEEELDLFHRLHGAGLDPLRHRANEALADMQRAAERAARAVEAARAESRRIIDEWLMVTRERAQFERGVGLNGRAEDDVALAVTEVAS